MCLSPFAFSEGVALWCRERIVEDLGAWVPTGVSKFIKHHAGLGERSPETASGRLDASDSPHPLCSNGIPFMLLVLRMAWVGRNLEIV